MNTLEQFFKEEEKQVLTYSDYVDVTKTIDKVISEIDVTSYVLDDEFYLFVNQVTYDVIMDLLTLVHNLPNSPLKYDMKDNEREYERISKVVEKKLVSKKMDYLWEKIMGV